MSVHAFDGATDGPWERAYFEDSPDVVTYTCARCRLPVVATDGDLAVAYEHAAIDYAQANEPMPLMDDDDVFGEYGRTVCPRCVRKGGR